MRLSPRTQPVNPKSTLSLPNTDIYMMTLPRGGLDARLKPMRIHMHVHILRIWQRTTTFSEHLKSPPISHMTPLWSYNLLLSFSFPRTELDLYLFFVTKNEDAHAFGDTHRNYRLALKAHSHTNYSIFPFSYAFLDFATLIVTRIWRGLGFARARQYYIGLTKNCSLK